MTRRILVTGGAGFIGSALCRHLMAETNSNVAVVDKLTYAANLDSLASIAENSRYRFFQADIADAGAMERVFRAVQPDIVFHLAAESHVDRSITESGAFVQTNIVGTYTLLEAARAHWLAAPKPVREAFRFIHVSTDEVYGSLGETGKFSETTPYDPSSPYSASKAASDHLAISWYRTYGLPVVVSNCSNNYGPYHFPEKLVPLMILNGLSQKKLPVYGDGSNVRDWLYVDDHARALTSLMQAGRPGETYNIGGNCERTNLEVVERICDALDRKVPADKPRRHLIEFAADRPGHDYRYAIDASKIEHEIGWRPLEDFESGLDKTVDWYLENRWWWEPIQKDVYADQRLGILPMTARA